MSRTTTREIVQVCTELAKLDRKGKAEVLHYLQTELKKQEKSAPARDLEPRANTAATLELGHGAAARAPVTYTEGGEK